MLWEQQSGVDVTEGQRTLSQAGHEHPREKLRFASPPTALPAAAAASSYNQMRLLQGAGAALVVFMATLTTST